MYDSDTVDTIINFVDKEISKHVIPYKKGNSILIGKYAVRQSDQRHLIFDCDSNKMIDQTFSKTAAIAIAKSLLSGVDIRKKIHQLDDIVQKNYFDAVFYKNIIEKSKNETVKQIRKTRLELALENTQNAYEDLEQFVLFDHK